MSKFLRVVHSDVQGNVVGAGVVAAPATATATSSSTQVVAANPTRRGLIIINLGAVNVSFSYDGVSPAIVGGGITLTANGTWVMDQYTYSTNAVLAISASTPCTLSIQEYN
jgi:hypothetical protein